MCMLLASELFGVGQNCDRFCSIESANICKYNLNNKNQKPECQVKQSISLARKEIEEFRLLEGILELLEVCPRH